MRPCHSSIETIKKEDNQQILSHSSLFARQIAIRSLFFNVLIAYWLLWDDMVLIYLPFIQYEWLWVNLQLIWVVDCWYFSNLQRFYLHKRHLKHKIHPIDFCLALLITHTYACLFIAVLRFQHVHIHRLQTCIITKTPVQHLNHKCGRQQQQVPRIMIGKLAHFQISSV